MSCRSISKLIYLKREELSKREIKKLNCHLEVCKSCQSERIEFEAANKIISKLNKVEPTFSDPFLIEENIVKMIEQFKLKDREFTLIGLIDKITEFLSATSVRFAMIAFLFMIFSFYFLEESSIVIGVSSLEESTAKNFNQEIVTSGVFEDQLKLLNAFPELYKLLNGTKNFALLSDDWIIMNKTELKSMMQLYNNLNSVKSKLPSNFETEYPLLTKFINRDLDKNAIDELLNQKDEILVELDKYLKKGGFNNEIKK